MNHRLLLPSVLVLVACSADSGVEPDPDPDPPLTPASITAVSGLDQVTWPGAELPNFLVVEVRDSDGQPLAGASVSWSVTRGGGAVQPRTSATGPDGLATTRWTLGRSAETQSVRASTGASLTAEFGADLGIPGSWEALASMSFPVRAPSVATDGSRLFVFGGARTGTVLTGLTQIFDPATGAWSMGAPMPTERAWSSAVHVAGRIHVLGGVTEQEATTTDHWIYDIAADSWSPGPEMPVPAASATAGLVQGLIVVAGGIDGPGEYADNVLVYDPGSGFWFVANPAPAPSIYWQGASIGGRFLVAGGEGEGRTILQGTWAWDPVTDAWSEEVDMPRATAAYAGTAVAGLYCILGGRERFPPSGDSNTSYDQLECYEPELDVWLSGPRLAVPVQEPGAVQIGEWLYVVAGRVSWEGASGQLHRLAVPGP